MLYGLTGAMQTSKRGLDNILQDGKHCVDNYEDDCIVFSNDISINVMTVLSQSSNTRFMLPWLQVLLWEK